MFALAALLVAFTGTVAACDFSLMKSRSGDASVTAS
jgi:hypothetical protein